MTLNAAPSWPHRHLFDVDALDRHEIEACLDLSAELRERRRRRERLTLLSRETVGLAFFEASTRTRVSFELAARAVGAEVIDLGVGASSVSKGESLLDTLRILERTGVGIAVLRHSASGAPYLAARGSGLRIVNGGDGSHAHPTQALLDALTLRDALGGLEGRSVAIVGDVAHSRVARSNLHVLVKLGAAVRVAGPRPMVAGFGDWPGVEVSSSLEEALAGADAVMTLRIQLEREAGGALTSIAEYVSAWGLTSDRMELAAPDAPILHPGPTNEGVEISAELAASSRSLIGRQVENGVALRMALLVLLAGTP